MISVYFKQLSKFVFVKMFRHMYMFMYYSAYELFMLLNLIYFLNEHKIIWKQFFFCSLYFITEWNFVLFYFILYRVAKTTSIRLHILCKILPSRSKMCSGHKILYTTPTETIHANFLNLRYFHPTTATREECIYLHTWRTIKDSLHVFCYTHYYVRCVYLNVSLYVHNIDRLLRTYAHLLLPKLPPFSNLLCWRLL